VLERIDVVFRCLLDEIPVKDLPAVLFVKNPLGTELPSLVQPVGNSAGQAADSGSGEGGERGDDGGVHRCSPQPATESSSADYRADYYDDVDECGPSEISRELRCPDK
jgi:hypothetical protein